MFVVGMRDVDAVPRACLHLCTLTHADARYRARMHMDQHALVLLCSPVSHTRYKCIIIIPSSSYRLDGTNFPH